MSDEPFSNLLYDYSPFLFDVNKIDKSVESVLSLLAKAKVLPLHGVCHELCVIAQNLSRLHIEEYSWLKSAFNCNVDDLDWFFLGYTTIPTIIIGACLMKSKTFKEVLPILAPPTTDKRLVELNNYKIKHLANVFTKLTDCLATKPSQAIKPIYEYLNTEPFNTNYYFLAGIESSKITALDLSPLIDDKLSPSH